MAAQLADGVEAHLGDWVVRSVRDSITRVGCDGLDLDQPASIAATAAVAEVAVAVRTLLETDIDRQTSTPLTLLRSAVRFPTQVLLEHEVPAPVRPAFESDAFPDDLYGLTPANFGDVAPELHELGLQWSAAKAYIHLKRRATN